MKNLLIVLTLILGVSIFSSCSKEECETCAYNFAWVDAPADWEMEADSDAADAQEDVMDALPALASGDICDDDLTAAKDAFNADTVVKSGDAMMDEDDETIMVHPAWAVTMDCQASE